MTTEERITRIEKATLLMQELVLRHEERLDDFGEKSRQSREEFDFKMNALIDAQIKLEDSVQALQGSVQALEISVQTLEKSSQSLERASRSQLKRIENLEQI